MKVPWGKPRSRFMALFERLVIDWLSEASISAVARSLQLTWDEVDGVMQRAVARGLERCDATTPEFIGVDEKSFKKRHEYVTVVCDLSADKPYVLHIADGRSAQSLSSYFDRLTPDKARRSSVSRWTARPLYQGHPRSLGSERAEDMMIFDKSHIAKHFSDAVNKIRRQEHKELMALGDDSLKGARFKWLRSSLKPSEYREFERLRRLGLRVARAWAIKETAALLWFYERQGWAEKQWNGLIGWMQRSRLPPMVKLARILRNHFRGVPTQVPEARP